MILRFNDNTELSCISVYSKQVYYQNANREAYDFHFSPTAVTFEQLELLFGDKTKTNKLYLDDGENSYLHEDFTIRMSLSLIPVETEPETSNAPAKYESRFVVSMARKTYMEKLIEQLMP